MEFDLSKIELKELAIGEIKFIQALQSIENLSMLYSGGFWFEQIISQKFREQWEDLNKFDNIAILRVGSGGRLDGGGYGENELIFLADSEKTSQSLPKNAHLSYIYFLNKPIPFFAGHRIGERIIEAPLIEYKSVNTDEYLSYYSGSLGKHNLTTEMLDGHAPLPYPQKPWKHYPERILDAEFIVGSPNIWHEAKQRILHEITKEKKIIEQMKSRKNDARKICETGVQNFKGKILKQFDQNSGTFFYLPKNGINGMKYSFLRYTQLELNIRIYEYIKKRNLEISSILDLPSPLEDKIRYIFRKGWSKNEDALINIGIGYTLAANLNILMKFNYAIRQMHEGKQEPEKLTFGKEYFEKIKDTLLPNLLKKDLLK